MPNSNYLNSYTGVPGPKQGTETLIQMAPSLLIIIASWAHARGTLFITPEQKEIVIHNYCKMAALNN